MQFNPSRLKLARNRRKLTLKALAESVGLTSRMVSEYEKDYCEHSPPEHTVEAFSQALGYPSEFFLQLDDIEEVCPTTVSFRSLKSMRAAQKNAAIGAGSLGVMINDYFESKFNLPVNQLPDYRGMEPEAAALALRKEWKLGNQSISNMIHLLEVNGIRVFSLAENTQTVDAFSFWKGEQPFVFLNTQKSPERGRFDSAHELGHLVLHRHGIPQGKDIEAEADQFASFFLMPRRSIVPYKDRFMTLNNILQLKRNWNVSAMALIMQMKNVGTLTEWQHRTLIIEASKAGLRKTELNGIEREKPLIIEKVISALKEDGLSLKDLARSLFLPIEEVYNLLFRVGLISNDNPIKIESTKTKVHLTLVK